MVVSYSLRMSHPLCLHGTLSVSGKIATFDCKGTIFVSRFNFLIYYKLFFFLAFLKIPDKCL
jgi:hypothetical protein